MDADQQPFDAYRVLQHFKCDEHILNDTTKYTIIKTLTDALHKIAKFQQDPKTAITGLIQYRLLAPTYLLVPYRDDIQLIKQNKLKRIQHYEQKRWNKLLNMIEYEQQKHNDRELRRNNNITNDNNAHNGSCSTPRNISSEDDQKQILDTNTQTRTAQHIFVDSTRSSPYQEPIDLNAVANNVQQMKYYHDDSENTIKQRIRRSIKKAKKGQWKKADMALDDGAIINLHINNNWNKTQQKFVAPQTINNPTISKPPK